MVLVIVPPATGKRIGAICVYIHIQIYVCTYIHISYIYVEYSIYSLFQAFLSSWFDLCSSAGRRLTLPEILAKSGPDAAAIKVR